MSSDAVPVAPDLGNTFGAAYVGAMVTMVMYGITTLQTYFYYITYPHDSRGTKSLVGLIWVLDTFHSALVCQTMYHYLVSNFGVLGSLLDGSWQLFVSIAINVCIAFVVQIFFLIRIYRLCGPRTRWWLTPLAAISVFAHFGFGIATTIKFGQITEFSRLHEIVKNPVTPFAVTAVLSDVVVAAALCALLWNERTEFDDTNHLIHTLIIWAVNRCLLTSVVATVESIVFALRPRDFWFLAIDFVVGKLYANSLLATLNARRSMKGRTVDAEASDLSSPGTTGFQVATAISGAQTTTIPRGMLRSHDSSDGTDTRGIEIELQDHYDHATK